MRPWCFRTLCILFFSWSALAQSNCDQVFRSLNFQHQTGLVSLNLKKAQELAEPFVNRNIASEVLADPGVEMAMEYASELDQIGSFPLGQKEDQQRLISEAIEEALLSRGMSPGQAKKAATGWTKAMSDKGVLQGLVDSH